MEFERLIQALERAEIITREQADRLRAELDDGEWDAVIGPRITSRSERAPSPRSD